jgi:pilus assembly protein CpaB
MAILGVASLAGVCCVGVLLHGMAGAKAPAKPVVVAVAPPPPTTVRVLVARHDMNVGDRIQAADMNWQAWPISGLNPAFTTDGAGAAAAPQGQLGHAVGAVADAAHAAMSNPADGAGSRFVGAIVRDRISMNEPLIAAKVVQAGGSGVLAVTLDPGMRAVALPLTAESAAGGFILPGDHVDVLLARQVDSAAGGAGGHVISTVMKNVRVLAVDQNMSAQKAASAIGATATVEATPAQAEMLVLAKASGTLTLSLRSYADAAGGAQVGSLGHDGQGAGMAVRVFRNGVASAVQVSQ